MRMKRNKFVTFIFSLIPGAGHMFMGFMKMGVSLMAAATLIIFLASWLNISPLLFLLPILWFYSFFDCINKRYSTDEEFAGFEDKYLFTIDKLLASGDQIFKRRRLMAGILLLLLGAYLIWNNLMYGMGRYGLFSNEMYYKLRTFTSIAPQFIVGVIIIVIGVKLVLGRRKERGNNA